MKSIFFQQPLEYCLTTETEQWCQGDIMRGKLQVDNRGTEPVRIPELEILLAHGVFKQIKTGMADAWIVLSRKTLAQDLRLDAKGTSLHPWSLPLAEDCPITEKSANLFLLFGGAEALSQGGRIDLKVLPIMVLQNFLQTFGSQFRFAQKEEKYKKGWIEVKMLPPTGSKEYPSLEDLMCRLRLHEAQLEVQYHFRINTLGRVDESTKLTQKIRFVEQQASPEQYRQSGNFPNRAHFRKMIAEALETAKPGVLF